MRRGPNRDTLMVTPTDANVLQLREEFFATHSPAAYFSLPFHNQMLSVDIFIRDTIIWEADYSYYHMIGTYLSPHEVIERRHGDCQGQVQPNL